MAAPKGYNASDYRDAIKQAKGNVTEAAEALNVSRTAVYDAIRRWKTVREELHKWRQTAITEAEGRLFDAMREDEEWAIRMILRTQRPEKWEPKRQQEVEHSGNVGLTINIPEEARDGD
jgi:hypothetical protein